MTAENPLAGRSRDLPTLIASFLTALLIGIPAVLAAPPDLTNGGVQGSTPTINLGPTGMRGWIYSDKQQTHYTGEARQILVTAVDPGSPADGVLAVDDVILGADGTGIIPIAFTSDARRSLAQAIADAEASTPATLKFLRWRAGSTTIEEITLTNLGAYTATAPYNCPKSTAILNAGLQYVFNNETSGRYTFGALSLLASGNAAYDARIQSEARALVPSAATMAQMMSDERDATSMITWQRGHTLIFLAEYYLATNDAVVLPAVEAYAVNIAKNQSLFGTVGHIFAEKNLDGSNNGPMGGVYGVVNSTGLPCFVGLLLAKECGLTNPELDPAIERSNRFFAYYAGKGAIPYGEHEPYIAHESNGKSGLAAVAFALQTGRETEQDFFARMATAATGERERGHTGAFFNYLWSPLGANAGGEEAAASHFSRISWILDLHRRWDGGFDYDNLNGEGPNSGSTYHDFKMSTAALLLYAAPLRELRINGRNHDPLRWLSSADVAAANFADDYDATSRTTNELISDLGQWSPKVRRNAANELGARGVTGGQLNTIENLAEFGTGDERIGACRALGAIKDNGSAPVLARLLTDPVNHVRFMAAESLRYFNTTAKESVLDEILLAAASTAQPVTPIVQEDPLHFAHGKLAMLLFYSGNAYGPKGILWNDNSGVDRNLLYPAIRGVAGTPAGLARSTLSRTFRDLNYTDTVALADTIVDAIQVRAPADKMFSGGVRQGGIEVLQTYGFAETVPLSIIYAENDGRGSAKDWALGRLELFAGSCTTVVPDPDVIGWCESMLTGGQAAAAQAVLDAIDADTNPTVLTPLKSIQSITPDDSPLMLPADSTTLRVVSDDFADGDSVFTWVKLQGPGNVTFTPNGTGPAEDTVVDLDDTPGVYIFQVTMSDPRGLTEVSETVSVTLYDSEGNLPPDDPPTAFSQSVPVFQASSRSITLGAIDPEGYALTFAVTTPPTNGTLSGTAPDLVYTPTGTYTGPDNFTFEVTDSGGQTDSATVSISVNPVSAFELSLYEPFDYLTGGIDNENGGVGFAGPWDATRGNPNVDPGSKTWGSLVTTGNHVRGAAWSGMVRPVGTTLADAGLLDNGATLWFSVVIDLTGQNTSNADFNLALCNATKFDSGTFGNRENLVPETARGIGVTHSKAVIEGVYWQDVGDADGVSERSEGPSSLNIGAGRGLVVGRIDWGADNAAAETLTLYAPGTDMILGAPILDSWTTPALEQSQFNMIAVQFKDTAQCDEIRFASTYSGVAFGTVANAPTDYDTWTANYPGIDLTDPNADWDDDGLTNDAERHWGLHPGSNSSTNPVTLNTTAGSFSYTRRDASLTALNYTVWVSPDMQNWTLDYGAAQSSTGVDANGIETMDVTLSPHFLTHDELFLQVGVSE